jgi:hypothetical protein
MILYLRAIVVAATVATLAGCSKAPSPQTGTLQASHVAAHTHDATATESTPVIAPRIECSDATAKLGICGAFNALKEASEHLNSLGAQVSILSYGEKWSSRHTPAKVFAGQISQANKTLDAAAELLPHDSSVVDFAQVSVAYRDCVARIVDSAPNGKGILEDITGKVTDSCRFHVQRLVDAYFRGLGVRVQSKSSPDVFGLHWGDSMATVRKQKGTPSSSDHDSLTYSASVAGLDSLAFLSFVNDKLDRVTYVFTSKHADDNLYINDFDNAGVALKGKYGKPETHGVYWRNDLYKDDRTHWGVAIAAGQMYMDAHWETDDTEITHRLLGDNFSVTHGVSYVSREFRLAAEAAERASAAKNL